MKIIALIFYVLLASSFLAQAADYTLEENKNCPVPGITVRWQAAYCMAKNETDDYENDGVTECITQEEKSHPKFKNACDENAYWKKKICSTLSNNIKEAEECFKDSEKIPRIVKFGVGG